MSQDARLVVISNRLPFSMTQTEDGLRVERSSGGLVSALLPLFRRNGGCWIGWPGTAYSPEVDAVVGAQAEDNYSLRPVFLTDAEKECFYHGCSNEIIWPLFHDLPSKCNFDPRYWTSYRTANDKFADSACRFVDEDDFIWVHDYHLMLLANSLRSRYLRNELAYFHHIPFPTPDIFEKLPWRNEIARGLLSFDSIGFQTDRDRRNFLSCIRRIVPGSHVQKSGDRYIVQTDGTYTSVGSYPIGIDFDWYATGALGSLVTERVRELKEDFAERRLILGIDRLDYTKGILHRLHGYRHFLRTHAEWVGRVQMLQVVVPSRESIPSYHDLREQIEQLVGEINSEFGSADWTPLRYLHRSLSHTELLAFYSCADVALVTPLKDGMNLVAKEYCATRNDNTGVLVLSEFAGAAVELACGALIVNPYDVQGVAAGVLKALTMSREEQTRRMEHMRSVIETNDIFHWCKSVCSAESHLFKPPCRSGGLDLSKLHGQLSARAI